MPVSTQVNLPTFRPDAQPSTTPTSTQARPSESAIAERVTEPDNLSR